MKLICQFAYTLIQKRQFSLLEKSQMLKQSTFSSKGDPLLAPRVL